MNLLDENIRDDQRALLRKWRIPFRQVGKELLHSGIEDENLIPFLHQLRSATLFTQDEDFLNAAFVTMLMASYIWTSDTPKRLNSSDDC